MDSIGAIIAAITAFIGVGSAGCIFVVFILMLGLFGFLLYRGLKGRSAAIQAAQSWPSTHGMVLSSTVRSHRSGNSTSHYPEVVYQYTVGGASYQNNVIKAGDRSMRITTNARATVERYPVGAEVAVYYDPANPKDSALER